MSAARPEPYVFAGNPLDRVSHLRRDEAWLAAALADPDARLLPFWQLRPLVGAANRLAWQPARELAGHATLGTVVLLGQAEGRSFFAADFSALPEPEREGPLAGCGAFVDARGIAPQLPVAETGVLAQARALVDWHLRHGFCAACGAPTRSIEAGYSRRCTAEACKAEHFPRTDPVVIMLIVRADTALLGRQARFSSGIYSALAGFVEPGETIEDAVRREVAEEAGISVGAVRYHSSQPWPFPSSLMIGCIGEAESGEIRIDGHEIEDARWFPRYAIAAALDRAIHGATGGFRMPPPLAIAHQLARWWVAEG
ncbi:MAG: NAD(+) diphosphatase [Alphaproteobacteria bacterium]|nr:NAD(+) diphosphatase [Alphaproteobacteria bacterium]